MNKNVISYLKGLVYSYIATLIFFATGWINSSLGLPLERITEPLVVALIIWTIIFPLSQIIWTLLLLMTAFVSWMGFLIGLGVLGYGVLKLAQYLLSETVLTFTEDEFILVIMGGVYGAISLIRMDTKEKTDLDAGLQTPDDD